MLAAGRYIYVHEQRKTGQHLFNLCCFWMQRTKEAYQVAHTFWRPEEKEGHRLLELSFENKVKYLSSKICKKARRLQ
jgi:hypothetical protein